MKLRRITVYEYDDYNYCICGEKIADDQDLCENCNFEFQKLKDYIMSHDYNYFIFYKKRDGKLGVHVKPFSITKAIYPFHIPPELWEYIFVSFWGLELKKLDNDHFFEIVDIETIVKKLKI